MANKVTLADVGNLIDATTAATTINSNSAAIVAAVNNTLSLDGTSPNQMQANLDMNSNHIINLPAPASANEPVRSIDLQNATLGIFSGAFDITSTANSTSTTTGSIVTAGGVGIAKDVFIGGALNVSGNPVSGSSAAYTLKGNATGSTASTTDISIPALTLKASPSGSDLVMIVDAEASNALKYSTVSAVGSAGSVSSIGGSTGIISLGSDLTVSGNVLSSSWTTGDLKDTHKTSADAGWIFWVDGTIGNASSSATVRANTDTANLFALYWNGYSNTICPVSSGRGSTAAADFAANKTITLPLGSGRIKGIAGSGSGLTTRVAGTSTGTETQSLTTQNLPPYTPSGAVNVQITTIGPSANGTGICGSNTVPFTATSSQTTFIGNPQGGTSTAFSIMQPVTFVNTMVKL